MRITCPLTKNLGDFFNVMPVISGISKSQGEPIDLVVSDNLMVVNGFRDFMEYQPCINSLRYQKEIINMDINKYIVICYSQEEFRNLTEMPDRPIETMRHEKFVRDNYPNLAFEVDDNFVFQTNDLLIEILEQLVGDKYLIGDRWLHKGTDTRRASNIFQDSGLFDDKNRFIFLNYKQPLMENAKIIIASKKPFIGTFTGSGMLADLLNVENYCVWDQSMVNWNNAPIEYSYYKHYYKNRKSKLTTFDLLAYNLGVQQG